MNNLDYKGGNDENQKRLYEKTALAGIAGIVAAGKAPAFPQDMNLLKLQQTRARFA